MNVKLLVVQGKPAGRALLFGPGEYYLGRGPECHIRFNSDWVSRQHCILNVQSTQASLRDLSSRNGTLINGNLLEGELLLHNRDLIQLGPVVFEVHFDEPAGEKGAESPSPGGFLQGSGAEGEQEGAAMDSTAHHPAIPPLPPKD